MPQGTEAIKVVEGALSLGFSVSDALQRALGMTFTEFASAKSYSVQSVSMCVRFYDGRVYPEIRDDICTALELPREYLDRIIEAQRSDETERASA